MAAKHPFAAITFDSVVYLGAGYGDNLDELLTQINANHWHLVEGDTKKHKPLQKTINALQNSDKVTLHKHVVSDDGTTKIWYSYNLDEFSGLKKAKELDQLFPGLKLKQEKNVDTQALPDFLRQLELSSKENNLLIIDLPGQALELIESILKAGQKPLFSQMVLTATTEQAFEQGGTLERIKQWLDKQGYHTRNEPYDDPDFPVLYYSFDKHSAAEFAKLKKERNEAVARASDAEKERDEAVARATGTSKELEQIKKERDDAVARASGTSKELEQLKKERDDAVARASGTSKELEQLQKQHDEAVARASGTSKELEQLKKERDEAVARASGTSKELEQAKKERDDAVARASGTSKELEQLKKERDEAVARASGTRKELEQLKQQLNEKIEQTKQAQSKIKELEDSLTQTNEEKQKHIDWAHNLKSQLDEAVARASGTSQELEQTKKERDEQAQWHQKNKDWAENLKKQLEQTQAELKEQQRSSQLSTKLLAKVEADASELRERYAEKVKSEQELKDLIKELHAKLQAASHFYHKLEQEHPELLEEL